MLLAIPARLQFHAAAIPVRLLYKGTCSYGLLLLVICKRLLNNVFPLFRCLASFPGSTFPFSL